MSRRQIGDPRRTSSPYVISLEVTISTLVPLQIVGIAIATGHHQIAFLFYFDEEEQKLHTMYDIWENLRTRREMWIELTMVAP